MSKKRSFLWSASYFLIRTNVSFYESFVETTRLSYSRALSPKAKTRLLYRLESTEAQRYSSLMCSCLQEDKDNNNILALDPISIYKPGPYWIKQEQRRRCVAEFKCPLLGRLKEPTPDFYRFYDGNVPDVSSIRHTISDQALSYMKNVILVADKGYYSVKNINDCLINKVEFIFNVRLGTKGCLVRELINKDHCCQK